MKKRTDYIVDSVDQAIGMLHQERTQRPENSTECSYRIVVLSVLSILYLTLRRLCTILCLFAGLGLGVLLRSLF